MRTTWVLPALQSVGQQCGFSTTLKGPLALQRSSPNNDRPSKQYPYREHSRLLHIFPSPFQRQHVIPDPFGSARPPTQIPLPPPATSPEEHRPRKLAESFVPEASSFREESSAEAKRHEDVVGSTLGVAEVLKKYVAAQRWMQHRIWGALTKKQWPLFERLLSNYWRCGLQYDEVTYTLKLHGYVLCHRQRPEKALLVLEEMKAAGMHPAVVRLNEGLVISQMELQDIFCALPVDAYQNLCKLAFHTAIKVQRQRRIRLREHLMAIPSERLFALTYRDVVALLDAQERALCFPDEALDVIEADQWSNITSADGNDTFLRALNEALGLEASCNSGCPLEELEDQVDPLRQPHGISSRNCPESDLALSELQIELEGMNGPGELQHEHCCASDAASTEGGIGKCTNFDCAPAPSIPYCVEQPHERPTGGRATAGRPSPTVDSTANSDLLLCGQISEAILCNVKPRRS